MNTKEWLRRGWRLNERINDLREEKERMFELATGTTGRLSQDNIHSSGGNPSEAKMIKYTEYSVKLENMIDELIDIKNELVDTIKNVEDTRLQRLLFLRYLEFEPWEKIACKMNYDYRHVLKLHGKALFEVEKIRER